MWEGYRAKALNLGTDLESGMFRYMGDKSTPLSLIQNGLIPWVERFYQERVEHNDQKDE
jgi:hypothetical protein